MKLKLKICGMQDSHNISEVAALLLDYMGFIFYENSKRFVGNNFSIPSDFPKQIKRVGVFVNEKTDTILQSVNKHQLDYVQLHGGESVAQCQELNEKGIGVIKVFSIDKSFDFTDTELFQPFVDFFLFDTKSENYGGTGKSFDWTLLKNYNQHVPFFLSGGLSAENIQYINELKNMNLYALDVNSGVEISPALKDIDKVKSIKAILNSIS